MTQNNRFSWMRNVNYDTKVIVKTPGPRRFAWQTGKDEPKAKKEAEPPSRELADFVNDPDFTARLARMLEE